MVAVITAVKEEVSSIKSNKSAKGRRFGMVQDFHPGDHCLCPVGNPKSTERYFNLLKD